jgi:hypothetical protein
MTKTEMEDLQILRLNQNQHKGSWSGWQPTRNELLTKINQASTDVCFQLATNGSRLASRIADLLNFLDKATELYGD